MVSEVTAKKKPVELTLMLYTTFNVSLLSVESGEAIIRTKGNPQMKPNLVST